MTKRHPTWSDDERVEVGRKHRTNPHGVPVVTRAPAEDFETEDITANYEGEALRTMRERRAHADLVKQIVDGQEKTAKLEKGHELLARTVSETRLEVANMSGKLDVLPDLVSAVRATAERAEQREHVKFTAEVDIGKAEKLDELDARKARRQLVYKVAGVATVAGAALGKFLHWLGVF